MLNQMSKCRVFLLLVHVLARLLVPALASASTGFDAETRVGGLDLGKLYSVGATRPVSLGTHQGYRLAYDDFASDSLLAARGVIPRSLGAAARSSGDILQTGGRAIRPATARALNEALDESLHPRDWGRALEALKRAIRLPNNFHGKITSTGDFLNSAGEVIDSLLPYLP